MLFKKHPVAILLVVFFLALVVGVQAYAGIPFRHMIASLLFASLEAGITFFLLYWWFVKRPAKLNKKIGP